MNKFILFRTDASVDIGMGHLMRCATLAHAFADKGWLCKFITCETSRPFIKIANLENFDIQYLSSTDTRNSQALSIDSTEIADILVIDSYDLDHEYETACRVFAKTILSMDDRPTREHDCDILLDQNYGRKLIDYEFLVPDHCKVLTGADKALLRPEFIYMRNDALKERDGRLGKINRVLISIGGSDPGDATSRIIEGLDAVKQELVVDIVLSSQSPALKKIEAHCNINPNKTLHINTTKMAELIRAADLVFGAGGMTSWERCCLAAPSVLVQVADNQIGNIEGLTKTHAARFLGMAEDFHARQVREILQDLIEDPAKVRSMSQASRRLCDGQWISRLIEMLSR
jgi:UDP-2,4-diacetamido-2,4,6-trideoxy-beta-L-altropyranose hydrolase